jgi:CheY-like chemotaxis protein
VPHHLLIADDSVTIQRVIKLTFADEDVDVIAVGDGSQALAAIDQAPPDIVLADVEMPGCSGYDVARHVRSSPRLSHIPVVLLTGAFEPIDEARASAVGCDGVLAKPFEPQAVLARVRELLSRPRPVVPVQPAPPPVEVPVAGPAAPAPVAPLGDNGRSSVPQRPARDLDSYFERLDQAFADLATARREAPASPPPLAPVQDLDTLVSDFAAVPASGPEPPRPPRPTPVPFSTRAAIDAKPEPPPGDQPDAMPSGPVPVSVAAHASPREAVPPAAAVPIETLPPPRSSRPGVQSLVEQFQGLLAEEAEGAEPPPPAPAAWPIPTAAEPAGPAPSDPPVAAPMPRLQGGVGPSPALSDETVDQIAARVIDLLAARIADGRVAEIVSRVAERLVREEIEQIKQRL